MSQIMTKWICTTLLMILCLSCEPAKDRQISLFTFPKITDSRDIDYAERVTLSPDQLESVFPPFLGKFKFGENIDLNRARRPISYQDDIISEYIIEDDDSLHVNGLELYVDYETEVYFNREYAYDSVLWEHYPVYFVNSTATDKIFIAKDGYVFGIQEAAKQKDSWDWRAIECSGFDFCGNGGWGLIIHPGEYTAMLMRKYKGTLKTDLRVRFQMGNSTFVSKKFTGTINPNQFKVREPSYPHLVMMDGQREVPDWLFYGAKPDTSFQIRSVTTE